MYIMKLEKVSYNMCKITCKTFSYITLYRQITYHIIKSYYVSY